MPHNFDLTQLTLNTVLWRNTVEEWLVAVTVALALAIVLTTIRMLVKRRLHRLAQFESVVKFPISRFVGALWTPVLWVGSVYVGSQYLTLNKKAEHTLDGLLIIALVVQGALWLSLLLDHWVQTKSEDQIKRDQAATATTLRAVGFLGRIAIWSVALLVMLDNLGVNVTALVAGLGVGGIAIALAAQNILGDLFASMSIVVDRPFVIGDFVVFDTKYKGTIEHIGLRSTRIRALTGEELIVPNSALLKANIYNHKRLQQRRVEAILGVTYNTPPTKLEKIPTLLEKIVESVPHAKFGRAHFKAFGDFALQIELVYDVTHKEYDELIKAQHQVNLKIMKEFAKQKIEFAYPTQRVLVHKA